MKSASGTFVLRIPPELHRRLRQLALRRGKSLNQTCQEILEAGVQGHAEPTGVRGEGTATGPLALLAARCREVFRQDLRGLILFGSVARGEEFPDSDLDLLVIMGDVCAIGRGLYQRWEKEVGGLAAERFDREVTPHFAHLPRQAAEASGLWLEVSIDGVVLWEQAREVSDVLRAIRGHLASGGAIRAVQHGHPYWVRG